MSIKNSGEILDKLKARDAPYLLCRLICIWAAMREKLSPVFSNNKGACASAQSDQGLCFFAYWKVS